MEQCAIAQGYDLMPNFMSTIDVKLFVPDPGPLYSSPTLHRSSHEKLGSPVATFFQLGSRILASCAGRRVLILVVTYYRACV